MRKDLMNYYANLFRCLVLCYLNLRVTIVAAVSLSNNSNTLYMSNTLYNANIK